MIGRGFLAGKPLALSLGDNIFYGDNLRALLRDSAQKARGPTVFAWWVDDPERCGVIEFDAVHCPLRIVERPKDELHVGRFGRGYIWLDAGAHEIAAGIPAIYPHRREAPRPEDRLPEEVVFA